MRKSGISVEYGMAEQFWDVYLGDKEYRKAGVKRDLVPHMSVMIDPDDGGVSLNAAYAPGSDEHRGETDLFNEHRDAIEAALHEVIASSRWEDRSEYDAFRARMAPAPRR